MDDEPLQMLLVLPGDQVRVRLPGRRPFTSTVKRVREDQSVDVADPRNGGIRTVALAYIQPSR